jgi:hypothetical protein
MILTVVMFGISATIFSLETHLFADGLLHPQKYPKTVIDIYGPEMTAHIILQGINVRHTRFLTHRTKRAFLQSILGDSIVIWRAYVVWGRRLSVVIAPIVLLVGVGCMDRLRFCLDNFFADSYAVSSFARAFAQSRAFNEPKYATAFEKTMIALSSLTLATNFVATSLVLSRILYAFLICF